MPWRRKSPNETVVERAPSIQQNADESSSSSTGMGTSHEIDYESDEASSRLIIKPDGWGTRHTMAFLGFWGFVASYAMRVNLAFAIVDMVSNNSSGQPSPNSSIDACPSLVHSDNTVFGVVDTPVKISPSSGEFDWNAEDQGIILGAFFWGYVVTQIPGGMLAERIGGKWPFGIGMLITAVFSLLTPVAARWGKGVLITVRIIQGLGEGVTNPSMHALLARWLPPLERSKMGTFVYAGAQIGTVIAMPLCGFLISSGFMGGWPSVFYIMGLSGIVWFVFWCIFVFDTPAVHPRIQAKELSYIQHSIGSQTSKHKLPTPWRKLLTSMPVLAILVAQTGHGWGLYTLLSELPTYMKTVLHFDIKSNGWLSALPYFIMWLFSLICSWFADSLQEKNIASTTVVRKVFNTIAHFGSALALIGAAYSGCDRLATVTLLTLAVGVNGACYASFQVNHIDLAPNHAAVMMGFTNGFANLCGIAAPYVAGVIIKDGGTLADWRLIFFIAAGLLIFDNIFYMIFASGEEQPWNRESKAEKEELPTDRDPLLPGGNRIWID